jgi:hypothetical protein
MIRKSETGFPKRSCSIKNTNAINVAADEAIAKGPICRCKQAGNGLALAALLRENGDNSAVLGKAISGKLFWE